MPTTDLAIKASLNRARLVPLGASHDGTFNGSIGNWVAISGGGATLSYDASIGVNGRGSVKIHQTAGGGPGGEVPIPGTFELGKTYQLLVAVWMEAYVAAEWTIVTIDFGDFAAADHSNLTDNQQMIFNEPSNGMPFDRWVYGIVQWSPTADRTDAKLRVRVSAAVPSMSVNYDYHVGSVSLIEVGNDSPGFNGIAVGRAGYYNELVVLAAGPNQGSTGFGLLHQGSSLGLGARVLFSQQGAVLQGPPDANGDTSEIDFYTVGAYATATQASIGRRAAIGNSDGWDEEIGPDYVGWIRGERSASEVEFQPDGPYDIILVDGEDDSDLTHRWQFETADAAAAANAMPSMGRLPQYAAAPHVGTEEEGESYYDTVLHKSRTWDGTTWQNHF